ncbi:MAG TPA: hypothetical protein VF267_06810 [Gammaproteobacteria bacterium]
MRWISGILPFKRRNVEQVRGRVEDALHSLRARGVIENFEVAGPSALLLQWGRGNFGLRLELGRAGRNWELVAIPITNPAGPFAGGDLVADIQPLVHWRPCGSQTALPGVDRVPHLELLAWVQDLEERHPVAEWLGRQFRRLAGGERPDNEELRGVMLLGVRRFLKTIPSTDRLHETIEPALMTLLRGRSRKPAPADAGGMEVIAGEDHAASLIGCLQETHPLAAKRAAQKYMTAR